MKLDIYRMQPRDEHVLREIHARQCAKGGFEFPFPDLKDPRFISTLVVRDADGNTVGGIFAYMRCEVWAITDSPEVCRGIIGIGDRIKQALRGAGVNFAHCFVPERVARGMGAILKRLGAEPDGEGYKMFSGRI